MGMELTNGEIESFARDGAVPLYGLFNDWIETLRAGLARNMAEPSPAAEIGRTLMKSRGVRLYQRPCAGRRWRLVGIAVSD